MNDIESKMSSAVLHFEKEINSLRTSRANASMLDNILVDYILYGKTSNIICIIFEELIRRTFKSLYKNIDILDNIYNFDINSAIKYEENIRSKVNLSRNKIITKTEIKELYF